MHVISANSSVSVIYTCVISANSSVSVIYICLVLIVVYL